MLTLVERKSKQMDSAFLTMEPLPIRGPYSTLNLLDAYQNVMRHLLPLEEDFKSNSALESSDSTPELVEKLFAAVCQNELHACDYVPKDVMGRNPSSIARIRAAFEQARDLRLMFLERNILEIRNDASGYYDWAECTEKIGLMKKYVQTHIDHLLKSEEVIHSNGN